MLRLWFSRPLISTTPYFLSSKTLTRPNLCQRTKCSSGVIQIFMKIVPISHFCHNLLLSFVKARLGSGGDVTSNWGKTCQPLGMMRFCSGQNSSKLTFLPMAKCSCVCRKSNFLTWWERKCLTTGIWGQIPQWCWWRSFTPGLICWCNHLWNETCCVFGRRKERRCGEKGSNPGSACTAFSFCSLSFPSHQLPRSYIIFWIWPSTLLYSLCASK